MIAMDPQATLNGLCAAVLENDVEAARDYAEALFSWIHRGGFHPDIARAIEYAWDNH